MLSANLIAQTTQDLEEPNFDWKPFTLELNSTIYYTHGLSLEKEIKNNFYARASASSDFVKHEFRKTTPRVMKLSIGVVYNLDLEIPGTSLRTGIELGVKTQPDGSFFGDIRPSGLIDVPLLVAIKVSEKISLNIGAISSYHRSSDLNDWEHNIYLFDRPHLALRYTFID